MSRVSLEGVDDTLSANLVDMQSFSKYNGGVRYLLNIIAVFSKRARSIPILNKMDKAIV